MNIECIFFAGQFLSLEPFLDQVNRHFALAPPPHIVLSDSLAGVRLNEIPERLGRQAYLIYQTSAKDYLSGREEGSNVYGVHACQVVNQLVRRVNEAFESGVRSTPHKIRQFFGIHRVSDVRESLVRQMEIAVRDRVEFEVGAPGRPKEKLVFRTGGLVDNRSFFIWKLSADGPKDEYPPKSPSPNEQ